MSKKILAAAFLSILLLAGCAHSKKKGGTATAKTGQSDLSPEEEAVRATTEDERLAPAIQRDVNALFFREKQLNPGGVNAFSPDRIEELEAAMKESERKSIKYYLENREFFDRVEDPGGGFRILANAKRLVPYRWTKPGRRKLFEMDTARVRESVANPCFSAIEDCGEYSSDATENLELIRAWTKKYSEEDFASDRDKFLREYAGSLKRYEDKVLKKVPKKARGKTPGTKEASEMIGSQRKAVESLMSK